MCWKCKPGQLRSDNWHQIDALYEQERFRDALNEAPAAAILFVKVFKLFIIAAGAAAGLVLYAEFQGSEQLVETLGSAGVVQQEDVPPSPFQ